MTLPPAPSARPAPPRPASTVVLLRDTADGIETWLLRRVKAMTFAAEMSVFPGGRVDEADGAEDVPWVGGEPESVAARFGCSVSEARAALVAAVRETFEETGVLVTSPARSGQEADFAELRRDLEARTVRFGAFLADTGLSVDAGLIRPWSHWITPVQEPRRFDTYSYVAALPAGAQAQADSGEASHAEWIAPALALQQFENEDRPMLTPTVLTLQSMAGFERVADVLAASGGRSLAAIQPVIRRGPDGVDLVELPDGSTYPFLRPSGAVGPA